MADELETLAFDSTPARQALRPMEGVESALTRISARAKRLTREQRIGQIVFGRLFGEGRVSAEAGQFLGREEFIGRLGQTAFRITAGAPLQTILFGLVTVEQIGGLVREFLNGADGGVLFESLIERFKPSIVRIIEGAIEDFEKRQRVEFEEIVSEQAALRDLRSRFQHEPGFATDQARQELDKYRASDELKRLLRRNQELEVR